VLELVLSVTLYPVVQTVKVPLLATGVVMVALGLLLRKSYIGIITLFLDVISNFVDIISYIRLYAVGAASLSVAQAFNEMALDVGFDGLSSLGAALILFAGHALNIILAAMGVMVHGIRLNTLEFSGHAGVEWGGIHYRPFQKKDENLNQ
jgi:V/A-type H+-transporting ATPase subunit I